MSNYIVHTDGSCYWRDRRMGVGIAFFKDDSEIPFREESITIPTLGSSNEAEYYGVINALLIIQNEYKHASIILNVDSQLIYNQIIGDWECRNRILGGLLDRVWKLCSEIQDIRFNWVPRSNERQKLVDILSKKANLYYAK